MEYESFSNVVEGLKTSVISWNLNAKFDNKADDENESAIKELQSLFEHSLGEDPDFVIVGIQELVELDTMNVLGSAIGIEATEKGLYLMSCMLSALHHQNRDYEFLASHFMVGLWICTFCLKHHKTIISNLQTSALTRGIGGLLGNKGAVFVRFTIFDSSICFINSHFTAHQHNIEQRNADYYAILHQEVFERDERDIEFLADPLFESTPSTKLRQELTSLRHALSTHPHTFNNPISPPPCEYSVDLEVSSFKCTCADDHDVVVWLGDLNYRIDGLPVESVYDIIRDVNLGGMAY